MKRYRKKVTGTGSETTSSGLTITHNSVGSARVSKNGREIGAVWPTIASGGFAYGPVSQVADKGCTGEVMNSRGTANSLHEAAQKLAETEN